MTLWLFFASVRYDFDEVIYLISTSSSYASVQRMDIRQAIGYIDYLIQRDIDNKIFARWIACPQYQTMSLDEFKNALIPPKEKDTDEILDDVFSIIQTTIGG